MEMFHTSDHYHDRQQCPYLVRDAQPDDAYDLIRLLDQVGQEEIYIADEKAQLTIDQERALLEQRDPSLQLVLMALQDDAMIGSLEMVRGALKKNRHTAIFGMALFPHGRGRGIGEGLIRSGENWAKRVGVKKISLAVFSSNIAALRLYGRLGYEEEGRRYRQYCLQDQWVDEIWMARWI